jgi:hypothetical protein
MFEPNRMYRIPTISARQRARDALSEAIRTRPTLVLAETGGIVGRIFDVLASNQHAVNAQAANTREFTGSSRTTLAPNAQI